MKKMSGDIILHMCTINENHVMYGSWDMEHNRHFFLILDHFLPFYPFNNPEKKFEKKKKKTPGNIIIIHKCAINDTHDAWFLRYEA